VPVPAMADPLRADAQLGLVVHPRRDLEGALHAVREWASKHGAALGQVTFEGQPRRVAEPVDPAACDLLIALGGDGTTLAALHAAAPAARPVLGVACGSIGVLTSVPAERLWSALEQVAAGDWTPKLLHGLGITTDTGEREVAVNDFVAIRNGPGQVIVSITIDGELYARTAGDGLVISTPLGSSAYTMAAGGPLLGPGTEGMVVVPLAHHGGVAPPLVVGPQARVQLSVVTGYGGSRFELDGRKLAETAAEVTVTQRRDYTTMVTLAHQESQLASLRRRGLVVDAPRILAREARAASPGS
jgi:NAD+ kinase